MCEISERSVYRAIHELVSRKLVSIEPRYNENGSRRSNGYRLAMPGPDKLTGDGADLSGGTVTSVAIEGDKLSGGRCQDDRVTTKGTVLSESLPPHPTSEEKSSSEGRGAELCFPERLSEAQRRAIEVHVAELSHQKAQQVLDEIAGRIAQIRNPIGYCAALVRRFKRGEFRPEVGVQVNARREAERQLQAQSTEGRAVATGPSPSDENKLPERLRAPFQRARSKALGEQIRNLVGDESSSN